MPDRYAAHRLPGLLMSILLATASSVDAADGVTPDFGPNVLLFDPSTPDVQRQVDAVFARQERAQFGDGRHAILFKAGRYDADVQVGFYTSVLGLGESPDDVEIQGAVRATARWFDGNATCNFWRGVENLAIAPTDPAKPNVWATSQAVSMRRVHVRGDLHLWDEGWSSGGFLADSKVDGRVVSGSQQQWLSRNCDWGEWSGGNWNMVFVGVTNPPTGTFPARPYTVVTRTPIIREKPFLTVDSANRWGVRVPSLRTDTRGPSWPQERGTTLPIDRFHIARADRDDARSINAALDRGQHLLLTPGIYRLDGPLRVTKPGTIVLGIGYATLLAETGQPAMTVADVDGVTIAGLLLDAGAIESPTLLEVGQPGRAEPHARDPICLIDVFCRAGGAAAGSATTFVTIHARDVIGDNFWLWRADHGDGVSWEANRNDHGIIVNGDEVTIYGLFVEHTQKHQTLWNGERGRVYFYQSELPYDPPSQAAWANATSDGYASYKVADHVRQHDAWGLGIYSYFTHASVVADRAIEAPANANVTFRNVTTIRLGGKPGSGIRHILNDTGESVIDQFRATLPPVDGDGR